MVPATRRVRAEPEPERTVVECESTCHPIAAGCRGLRRDAAYGGSRDGMCVQARSRARLGIFHHELSRRPVRGGACADPRRIARAGACGYSLCRPLRPGGTWPPLAAELLPRAQFVEDVVARGARATMGRRRPSHPADGTAGRRDCG